MADVVRKPATDWWHRYPRRVHRAPEDIARIVQKPVQTPDRFPHVRFRLSGGQAEAFIPGTGLAIWEVAWLARGYDGDADAVAGHTLAPRELIEEGIRYAAEHAAETDAEIALHLEWPLEELIDLMPGMRVVTVESENLDEQQP